MISRKKAKKLGKTSSSAALSIMNHKQSQPRFNVRLRGKKPAPNSCGKARPPNHLKIENKVSFYRLR
jgi:hypothetical protein